MLNTSKVTRSRAILVPLATASATLLLATAGSAAGFSGHFGGGAHVGMRSGGFHGTPNLGRSSPRPMASFGLGGDEARTGLSPTGRHGSPDFGGASPHGAPSGVSQPRGGAGRGLGQFRGHSYDQFSAEDRERWSHGGWHYGWRHGRYGSWWVVDGLWFFYDEAVYPYPAYVGWEDGDDGDDPADEGSY